MRREHAASAWMNDPPALELPHNKFDVSPNVVITPYHCSCVFVVLIRQDLFLNTERFDDAKSCSVGHSQPRRLNVRFREG
jgi:hypothetical protein